MGYYKSAQVCINGHAINSDIEGSPGLSKPFCSKCGAKTISSCPHCMARINGKYEVPNVTRLGFSYTPPAYCHNCGSPYPWTESAIKSASELILEDENLTQADKEKLNESLPDIISETPRTQIASIRLKKALVSAGKFTVEGLRQFAIDFGCELAKKSIGL